MLETRSHEKKSIFEKAMSLLTRESRCFLPLRRPKQQGFSSKVVFSHAFCSDKLSGWTCETDNES